MFTKSLYIKVYSIHYLLGGTVVFTNNRLTRILFDGGYISNDGYVNTYNARPNDFLWPEEEDSLDMAKENPFDVVEIMKKGERSIGRSKKGELQYRYVLNRNTVIQNVKDKKIITIFSDMPATSIHVKGYKIPWR